jgi:hypothetical protein
MSVDNILITVSYLDNACSVHCESYRYPVLGPPGWWLQVKVFDFQGWSQD